MLDEGIGFIEQKVQQAIELIKRLKQENESLKQEIATLKDEIRKLREDASTMQNEREALKGKIDSAVSMLDKVDLDDMLESMAAEVARETGSDENDRDDT